MVQTCNLSRHTDIPILIEEINKSMDEVYGATPERLYLICANGEIAYRGGSGPHFFNLCEWENAIGAYRKTKV